MAQEVAQRIWQKFPGAWELSVIPENKRALAFWRKIIAQFSGYNYREEVRMVDYDQHQPQRVFFRFETALGDSGPNILIREFSKTDINTLVNSFARHNWNKPRALFERYFEEQQAKKRQVWIAWLKADLAAYVTLNWHSNYQPFLDNKIPELMDLNVLPPYRRQGIGSQLMDTAEACAAQKSALIGIGVGLYDGYGEAQKLYVKRGYIPDGRGPSYNYCKLEYGQLVTIDDDLVMWFTKKVNNA